MSDSLKKLNESFRLIFHIGAGKTGTSSIQASLRQGRELLRAHGYDYWGLMLETAPVSLYEWQNASASKNFLELDASTAEAQVYRVLEESVTLAMSQGIQGAIWSNEWFFGRHHNVIPALKTLESKGVRVDIIAYVRRHDSWAKSAYVQWGLKHKTYNGPLMTFKEYIRKRPVGFAGTLKPWIDGFPEHFTLRNFDVAGDAVRDFIKATDLPESVQSLRVNEAPAPEELLLRTLYNNTIKGEALPVEFDRQFGTKQIDFDIVPATFLEHLFPTAEDLMDIVELSESDRALTNAMLARAGQPEISVEPLKSKPIRVDQEKLLAILFQMLVQQSRKIQRMQRELKLLAQATGHEKVLK